MMFRRVLFRLSQRRAVATIMAGLIILSLILTALGTMVFVSQQYDQYQQSINKMVQRQNQGQSENIVANYPGLTIVSSISCGGCVVYNMSLSNLGGVGVQIARIYITSTGSGCTSLCVLNPSSSAPTSTSSVFQQSARFLNAGEVNHAVLLYLPSTIGSLPGGSPPPNTILIVTGRGNVFSFQWPFQIQIGGQSQSAFSAGIVRVAYQSTSSSGYDSKNEPGLGGTGTKAKGYCHAEPQSTPTYPPGASNAEEVTGVTAWSQTLGKVAAIGDSGILWFVNPWVTQPILLTAANGPSSNTTTLYLAVNITNTGTTTYTIAGGSLDLTWYGSNHIDGSLIGIYYNASKATGPQFYSVSTTSQQVAPTTNFQGIFRVTTLTLNTGSGGDWPPANAIMFWGSAALTDATKDQYFVGGVSLSSGLWIPTSC
jgi:hypothetical protein